MGYLLTLLQSVFDNGIFQKRSTSRTRIMSFINRLQIPFFTVMGSSLVSLWSLDPTIPVAIADPLESELVTVIRHSYSVIGASMIQYLTYRFFNTRYIVLCQKFPYFSYPLVYSPQWRFKCCCDTAISLVLSSFPSVGIFSLCDHRLSNQQWHSSPCF